MRERDGGDWPDWLRNVVQGVTNPQTPETTGNVFDDAVAFTVFGLHWTAVELGESAAGLADGIATAMDVVGNTPLSPGDQWAGGDVDPITLYGTLGLIGVNVENLGGVFIDATGQEGVSGIPAVDDALDNSVVLDAVRTGVGSGMVVVGEFLQTQEGQRLVLGIGVGGVLGMGGRAGGGIKTAYNIGRKGAIPGGIGAAAAAENAKDRGIEEALHKISQGGEQAEEVLKETETFLEENKTGAQELADSFTQKDIEVLMDELDKELILLGMEGREIFYILKRRHDARIEMAGG